MVQLRLSSAQVQLTENVIEVNEEMQAADLKNFMAALLPVEYSPLEDLNDIKLIYFGRVIGNNETLRDVLKVRPYDDPSHVYTIHFSISQTEYPQPSATLILDNHDEQRTEEEEEDTSLQTHAQTQPDLPHQEQAHAEFPFTYALGNGNTYIHGLHSYDTIQSTSEDGYYLVDQLENSSSVYEVSAIGSDGIEKTIQIPSSQCIINDTGDHQPYILLTKTAVSQLHQTLGIQLGSFQVNVLEPTSNTDHRGFNYRFRNSRINRWYNWRRPIRNAENLFDGIRVFGHDFNNISWRELPFYLYDTTLTSLEHFVATAMQLGRNGGLSRLFMCILGLVKFVVVLQIFDVRYNIHKKHPYIYYFIIFACLLLTIFDSGNANNIREILNRDLRNMTGRDMVLNLLQKIKECRTRLAEICNSINNEVVSLVIGNNRRGLIINDYGNLYQGPIMGLVSPANHNWIVRNAIILAQDVVCFVITLIPRFYIIFNYEMVRRVTKVEQELLERAAEIAAEEDAAGNGLHEVSEVNVEDGHQ